MSAEGIMLPPGGGRRIVGGGLDATIKSTMSEPALTSSFEIVIPAGYDVGAHVHAHGEEVFYVVEGELDILAFDPIDRSEPDWHRWESSSGKRYLHGGPGAFMFVPENVPHAFGNRSNKPTKLFFQSSVPGGHENYFDELLALLRKSDGSPDANEVARLRSRYDIEQLTPIKINTPVAQQAEASHVSDHTLEDQTTHEHEHPHDHSHDQAHEIDHTHEDR